MMIRSLIAFMILALSGSIASAHKPSDSYLVMTEQAPGSFAMQWDIALRDLDHAIGLDGDGDGALTWGELQDRHAGIAAFALSHLKIEASGEACEPGPIAHWVDEHSDGHYAVLRFQVRCSPSANHLSVDYSLLFDLDRQHRGVFSLASDDLSRSFVFAPDRARADFDLTSTGAAVAGFGLQGFQSFFIDGVGHMLGGFDHVLFLLVLLLPAITGWRHQRGMRDYGYSKKLIDVAKILTAFTAGHAMSLSAATLGYVNAPSQLVEITIAASIALAAFDNVRPIFGGSRWLIALVFGLIHGLGFANVLGPLDLPSGALALALLAFNLGLEVAQIMIAAVLLPLGWLLVERRTAARLSLQGGSVLAIGVSAALIADRAFDLQMMPF